MLDRFKLDNPYEVKNSLIRVRLAVELYDEYIQQFKGLLYTTATKIQQTQQYLNTGIYRLQNAKEQAKRNKDSDGAEETIQKYQKMLEICEEQVRALNRYNEELMGMQGDFSNVSRRSSRLVEAGNQMNTRVGEIIDRIVEAR